MKVEVEAKKRAKEIRMQGSGIDGGPHWCVADVVPEQLTFHWAFRADSIKQGSATLATGNRNAECRQ